MPMSIHTDTVIMTVVDTVVCTDQRDRVSRQVRFSQAIHTMQPYSCTCTRSGNKTAGDISDTAHGVTHTAGETLLIARFSTRQYNPLVSDCTSWLGRHEPSKLLCATVEIRSHRPFQ